MADLLTVKDDLTDAGWRGATLVKNEADGQHYVITSIELPWADNATETLVYEAKDENANPAEVPIHFVAGGRGMDHEDALADLSARIDDERLLTPEQAHEIAKAQDEGEFEAMLGWLVSQGAQPVGL